MLDLQQLIHPKWDEFWRPKVDIWLSDFDVFKHKNFAVSGVK